MSCMRCIDRLEPHRPPQLFRLAAAEPRQGHRHAQQLLLEERDTEGALQDRLQVRVRVVTGARPLRRFR